MNAALYATIWIALCLFVVGEAGKLHRLQRLIPPAWAWRLWTLGALLCALHIVIAFGLRHDWSHEAAVRETARQTADIFGIPWGGGVYVNHLFLTIWVVDAWWWRSRPDLHASRRVTLTWLLRCLYFVVILNAAVVFASPIGRLLGIPLVATLLWVWSDKRFLIHKPRKVRA